MPLLAVISLSRVQACACTIVLSHLLATDDKYVNTSHRMPTTIYFGNLTHTLFYNCVAIAVLEVTFT